MVYPPLTEETFTKFKCSFYDDPRNAVAQNACTKLDPLEVSTSRNRIQETTHVFTHRVENEGKPVTAQASSGRCWIFACLNAIRIPFMKFYNIEEFEFSQSYIFFWDKQQTLRRIMGICWKEYITNLDAQKRAGEVLRIWKENGRSQTAKTNNVLSDIVFKTKPIERSYYFLNLMVETARKKEPVDGRLVSFLLTRPLNDGGQWDMLVNLIKKHGLVPKKNFPESVSSESSGHFNFVLNSKLREYAIVLRKLVEDGASDTEIESKMEEQMAVIYRIVGICVGIPAAKFTWEYLDKSKQYHAITDVTPVEFYTKYVKPLFNVDDKVCLVTDSRPTNSYNTAYTVDCLGNVVGGRKVIYNNQPVELLAKLCAASIKNNEPVWFGCDVSKRFSTKLGLEDLQIHDFKNLFGVDISLPMTKAQRLLYGESAMSHAMVLTAVSLDEEGNPTKWRVENSWGDDRGDKGYLLMTNDWFKEYTYEVVVDKSLVPAEVLAVFDQEPVVLPAWDPMGTLA